MGCWSAVAAMFKYVALLAALSCASALKVGVGIADITGPSASVPFMGYAKAGQNGKGIHLRMYARAYAFENNGKTMMFVSTDNAMGSILIKNEVLARIKGQPLGKVYNDENLAISGTHTHSAPGGFHQYVLYEFPSYGVVHETVDAFADGIVRAMERCHANLQDASVEVQWGELYESNINRSPASYLRNPLEERKKYTGDTDKNMTQLVIADPTGKNIRGVLNWFAVHGTSMNNTNKLISSDNRGYASITQEKRLNPKGTLTGKGPVVVAFASTNLGDVSPNTNGAKCLDTGKPCDFVHSTCGGKNEKCVAFGPGKNGDMFESTQIIGSKQADFSNDLLAGKGHSKKIDPSASNVMYTHSWVDFSKLNVTLASGATKQLCKPSMGYAFAAGTTDGPGDFDFKQSTTSPNPLWNFVSHLLAKPSNEEKACQHPKPILLATGDISTPYDWQPSVLPLQLMRVGHFFIINTPFELTTMAGRRLREQLAAHIQALKLEANPQIVIAGLSNSYASYCATYEEFQEQRYEGASTIFGPHQLEGVIQEAKKLADGMQKGLTTLPGAPIPDWKEKLLQFVPKHHLDSCPPWRKWGQVLTDVPKTAAAGTTVTVEFQSANPRTNLRQEDTYLTIERKKTGGRATEGVDTALRGGELAGVAADEDWEVVATDADWETKYHWESRLLFTSTSVVEWNIPEDTPAGLYRIRHFGTARVAGIPHTSLKNFTGVSSIFEVTAQDRFI